MILSSKRIKELETENEELKKLLQSFSAKEEKLKRFDELIKKARIEYGDITQRKDQTAQTLELLENEKTKLNHEIQKISYEIKQLRELKIDEHNQLLTLNNALLDSGKISHDDKVNQLSGTKFNLYEEIDAAEKRKNKLKNETLELEKKYKETYQKIQEIKDVEQTLRTKIEKRKEELSIIIESHNAILEEQRENVNSRFGGLNDEEKKISDEVRLRADKLSEEEIAKKRIISELEDKISNKKTQLESLTGDYKTKTALLNEASDKNKQLLEEIEIKTKQLYELNESIEIATAELTDLDYGLNILGDEFKNLSKEFQDTKSTKDEIYSTLKEGAKEKKELEGYLKELRETTTILAQLKNDIEQGSGMSAKRFAGVLKYYSTYISEMYKQKIHLEKILDKKEKDVEEKDKLLYEKQSALNEIDKVMFIGQDTAELFQELIRKIQKQWEQIKNIVSFSETTGFSQIIQNKETLTENDPTDKKLSEFENTLKEMLKKSENYFNKYDEKRPVFKNEKREYGQRLNELNKNIRYSVNELSNLHSSINKIKEEHEEHRQDINKLVSMKKRLEEEISKYKVTIDKYEKIKQKILKEQEMIRGKKGIKEQKDQVTKHDESEKIPNPDNYNWVKT
jgi:chromosome segregation ATPase